MAVRIDIDALRSEAGPAACEVADKLLASGQPETIVEVDGGASCIIREGSRPAYEVWVGITADGFTAECDCPSTEELCGHAVALTEAALEDGFAWSSAATPESAVETDPRVAELAEVAGTLPARRLALLLAEHAATDAVLEARLLAYAGKLGPLTDTALADARRTIDNLAHEATEGRYWDLRDIEEAGRAIVETVQVLAQRPPTGEMLLLVEHAARVWDRLVPPMFDAWETYEEEPGEIGGALRDLHVQLCVEVEPDPDELAERLAEIIRAAEAESCLDEPHDYLAVLGRQRVRGLQQLRR
ncbi:SWIM zinc finger family protein [Micromonospora sp. CPCC 206060]|uniref:SWIM zinc finger family protein n=1 Tax=Micromonospora sp. CPCC 206060 TaxID=3122406 RepID=UPI002FF3B70B